jgi:hypothetical protein
MAALDVSMPQLLRIINYTSLNLPSIIEGLAEIYAHRFWRIRELEDSRDIYGSVRTLSGDPELLFNLHTSCVINAMETTTEDPSHLMIFHVCAKGIYEKKRLTGERDVRGKWKDHKMRRFENLVISSMSYSVCVGFVKTQWIIRLTKSRYNFPAYGGVEHWTLLVLLPHQMKRDAHRKLHDMCQEFKNKPLLMAMLVDVSFFLESASRPWGNVADTSEKNPESG